MSDARTCSRSRETILALLLETSRLVHLPPLRPPGHTVSEKNISVPPSSLNESIAKEESNENWQFYIEESTLGNPAPPKLRCIVQCLMLGRSVHRTPPPRLCCMPGAAAYVPRRRTTARATARHHHRETYIELLRPQVYLCRNAFVANLESVKHLLLEVRSRHSCT